MIKPVQGKSRIAKLAKYKDGRYTIKVSFPFDPVDVAAVKAISGRKWHPEAKVWTLPLTTNSILELKKLDFDIHPNLNKHFEEHVKGAGDLKPISIKGLKKQLYTYQERGVAFIDKNRGRALIADEMGLGKTVQAIAWLQLRYRIRPVLIICPASVKLNWAKEIHQWMGMGENQVEIISGTTPYILTGDIVIINYDILSSWLKVLLEYGFKAVIADESQAIKNNKAQRTKAVKKMAKHVPYFIALSGTPIVNRPIEFYNTIQILDRTVFPNWLQFTQRYCDRKHNGFGWVNTGSSNREELHKILSETIMIRRLKKEVLTDLPDKIRGFVPIEMDKALAVEYEKAETDFLAWMEAKKGTAAAERASNAETLAQIEILKQLAAEAKLPQAVSWIKDFLDSGEKLVVFYTHKHIGSALMKQFGKIAVKLDGSVTGSRRQEVVDQFQENPDVRLFCGNIKAAGVGITLTAASNVAFLELPWTPGDLAQAEDRCHRIGQKDAVNIHYLLAEDTIEEKMARILDEKRQVLDGVLDGTQTSEEDLIIELIENY